MSVFLAINHAYRRLIVDNSHAIRQNVLQICMNVPKAHIPKPGAPNQGNRPLCYKAPFKFEVDQ